MCETGGKEAMKGLADKLKKEGFNVVDMDLISMACNFDQLKKNELKGDVVIVLACDAGLYNLKKLENKEIKGVIAVVGYSNPRAKEDWVSLYKKLSKDYLILTVGCIGFEFAEAGLLDGKRFFHFGSCVNSSRITSFFIKLASEGNKNLNEMPFLVSSPKPITEKAIAISFFFASLGLHCYFGYPTLLTNRKIQKYLEKVTEKFLDQEFYWRAILIN